MQKNLILLNPSSGQNRALKLKDQLERFLEKYNVNYEMIVTESEDHLRRLVREYLAGRKNVKKSVSINSISAAGGDSTFTILVNEMIQTGVNVPLGIIPMGSSDDIALELGIHSIEDAVKAIAAGKSKRMDVGKITGEKGFSYYFPGQANMGIGVFVNRFVAGIQKGNSQRISIPEFFFKLTGKNQFLAGLFGMYRAFYEQAVPVNFTLTFQHKERKTGDLKKAAVINGEFVSLLFSKIRYWATGRLFLPGAKINDGKIHLLVIKKCGLLKTLQIMLKAANGSHIDEKTVQYFAASRFQLTAEAPFMIQVDGDIIQESGDEKVFKNITVEAFKDRIEVLV